MLTNLQFYKCYDAYRICPKNGENQIYFQSFANFGLNSSFCEWSGKERISLS